MICWWIYRSADIGWLKADGLVLVRQMPGSAKGVMFAAPNDLWCADYKGEFRLGNHIYCYPLTVTDQASRFLLLCEARVPYASANALFNLSKLAVWWLRLGIAIERIKPGHPA
jgi:transposase InsO family protein